MSIKPVAMIPEDEMQCLIDGHTAIVIPVGDALPDEVAIPDTHRIVPVQPTAEMIEAALYHAMRETDEDKYRAMGMIICIWDEMLSTHTATASQTKKGEGK